MAQACIALKVQNFIELHGKYIFPNTDFQLNQHIEYTVAVLHNNHMGALEIQGAQCELSRLGSG